MHELIQQALPEVGIVVDKENPAADHGITLEFLRL
jgi:hypothetical protein